MSEESPREAQSGKNQADQIDELRTIGFRLREMQRLLAVRAEQENRRLEAEGLDPVEEPRFRKPEERVGEGDSGEQADEGTPDGRSDEA